MTLKKHLPNSLTLLNLLSGCLGIILLFTKHLEYIPLLFVVSLLADFLDGLVARALGVSSPIGKELDSLADVVSFGVLPAMIMVYLMAFNLTGWPNLSGCYFVEYLNGISSWKQAFFTFFPLIIALFSALRLAKFNISEDQALEFKGLATPAASLFVMGLFIAHLKGIELTGFLPMPWMIALSSVVLSLLLMSNIPMFSLKLGKFSLEKYKWHLIFLALCVLFVLVFKWGAIAMIVIAYVILNIVRSFFPES